MAERPGNDTETTPPRCRMIGSKAVTFPVDRVKRSAPAGASPSRTLSKMLPEQNGAYGGHLDTFFPTKDRLAERQRTGAANARRIPGGLRGAPAGSTPAPDAWARGVNGSTPALQAGSGGPNPPGSIPRRVGNAACGNRSTAGCLTAAEEIAVRLRALAPKSHPVCRDLGGSLVTRKWRRLPEVYCF